MSDRELSITRLIDAPPEAVYRAWTEPELVERWFAPRPLTTRVIQYDARPGGAFDVVMESPDGRQFPSSGVFLEVSPGRRLVFTDAYAAGWVPSERPFMTAVISFEPEGGKTRYVATARHWTAEDVKAHEEMGFQQGWSLCADQLAEVAAGLAK